MDVQAAPELTQTGVATLASGGAQTLCWLALGVVGCVLLRRWKTRAGGGRATRIEVVETRALGGKRALHLVRVGERSVLIGASEAGLQTLVADAGELAREDASCTPPRSFWQRLRAAEPAA